MTPRKAATALHGDLDWLLRTTNDMLRCRSVAALLDLAYTALRAGLGYDRVGLLLIDAERRGLVAHVATDGQGHKFYPHDCVSPLEPGTPHARLLADPRLQIGGPGFIYASGATHEAPPALHHQIDGRPTPTMLVSLRTATQIIGLISIDNLVSGRPLTAAAAPPLVAYANALAVAIENVTLLEERARRIDDLDSDLRRRVEQLTWLQEAAGRLSQSHELESLLDVVYACVREGLGYDRVAISLSQADGNGRVWVREVRGTDEQGRPTDGLPDVFPLDDPALPLHGPDFYHLLQGHAFYYCPDRWAVTPQQYRYQLEGRMREQLVVALRHDGLLLGYISVDNLLSVRPIGADGAAPLVAFAGQAAPAISRAELWQTHAEQERGLARRVAELEWLRDVSRRVTAAATLDEMLDIVYDGIRAGLGYDRIGINLFDRATGTFEDLRGTDEHGQKTCPTDRIVTLDQDSPIWRFPGFAAALRGEEFYYTVDAAAECPPELLYLFDGAPAHNLMVPLRSGDKATGVISVDNLLSGRPINPQDAGPLVALGNQLGTAVENARLRERERAEHARLELLLESARALNSTLDRDQILHTLAERLVQALDAASAAFTEVDLAARRCRVLTDYAAPGRVPLSNPSAWGSLALYPILEEVLHTRVPFCGHVDDPDFPASERAYLHERQLEAELIVPVVVQGMAAQVLEVHWDRWVSIGPDTIALCTAIAEQAAVALENARLYADAAERAERDALTGLLNHRALLDYLDSALHGSSNAPCALLLIDVDNFKLFNDTYGHPVGDAVLNRVATTLREACRDGDVAGRYGGDEFALLLRGTSAAEAAAVTRRLHTQVRTRPYVTPDGTVIPLSISVGLACAPQDAQTRPQMIAMADQAMYEAKRGVNATRQRQAADLLGDTPFGVLEGLVNAVDAKDRYTREHSEDVTQLALLLAAALGLDEEQQRVLAVAGPLHDVGKIAVPDRILRKPGRLTAEEYAVIKRHVAYGVAIIRGVLDDAAVIDAVAYHHERWDGRGYPNGVPGAETPLLGRIMQVADAVSAMMMDRPYRQGMAWVQVVTELRAGAGLQFDRELAEIFIAATSRRYAATAS